SSQIPADFLKIQGFVSLLDSVFVGRLDDEDAQADALRLLKVPLGVGYENVIASLGRRPGGERGSMERDREPRQFVFSDGAGGVERIRVDFSGPHLQHLRDALDTTPGADTGQREQRSSGSEPDTREPTDVSQRTPEASSATSTDTPRAAEIDADLELEADLELGFSEEELLAEPGAVTSAGGEESESAGTGDPQ